MSYVENPPKNNNYEHFSERLKSVVGNDSLRGFAQKCAISPSTLSSYLSGDTFPTLDRLMMIADVSNSSYSWLATGNEAPSSNNAVVVKSDDITEVPQYDLAASAGAGSLVISSNPIAKFEFANSWLVEQGLNGKRLTVVPVKGDSMEPTLSEGDLMLVELFDENTLGYDGICVFSCDDGIKVKRLQRDLSRGGLHVISDNPSYRPDYIDKDFTGYFQVHGRMVRVLQRAKC